MLLDSYDRSLEAAKVGDDVQQQTSELSSGVHAASMVQSANGLVRLGRELECASLLDPEKTAAETHQLAALMDERAASGDKRQQVLRREMQQALRELETSFYSSGSRAAPADGA